jgi:hypothetical protein
MIGELSVCLGFVVIVVAVGTDNESQGPAVGRRDEEGGLRRVTGPAPGRLLLEVELGSGRCEWVECHLQPDRLPG